MNRFYTAASKAPMISIAFLLTLLFFLAGSHVLFCQTVINPNTEVSGTWTKAGSPYLVNGLAIVPVGKTLIIEPGVEIRFKTGIIPNDFQLINDTLKVGALYVKGKLIAEGIASQNITFTRAGVSGNWGCIAFHDNSNSKSIFKFCKIEYANLMRRIENLDFEGAVSSRMDGLTISHCLIKNNFSHGIYAYFAQLEIKNNIISNNTSSGIYTYGDGSQCKIFNNTIVGNGQYGLNSNSCRSIVSNCIFWGNRQSFTSKGNVYYAPTINYCLIEEDLMPSVAKGDNAGCIFNINPKISNDFALMFNSPCINAGNTDTTGIGNLINDVYGGKRINNGRIDMGATEFQGERSLVLLSPKGGEGWVKGNQRFIKWQGSTGNVKIEYSNNNGNNWITIINSTTNDGSHQWTVPSLESNHCLVRISDVSNSLIYDQSDTIFTIIGSSIENRVDLSGILTLSNSPYYISSLATILGGDSLVIEPGVEIRFKSGSENTDFQLKNDTLKVGGLFVKGKLKAEGTASQNIIFRRAGGSGNWGSIAFHLSSNPQSIIKYCKIEYANFLVIDTRYDGAVSSLMSGLTVSHCEIRNNLYHGIYAYFAQLEIKNSIISNNNQSGIYTYGDGSQCKIVNNTIAGNGEYGLHSNACRSVVTNCIFWDNKKSFISHWNGNYAPTITYCLIAESVMPATAKGDNVGCLFRTFPHFVDESKGNYHLNANSPCIDTGDPTSIYSNEPIPNGGRINMGAYGNTHEATIFQALPRIDNIDKINVTNLGFDTLTVKGKFFKTKSISSVLKVSGIEVKNYILWADTIIKALLPPCSLDTVDIQIINSENKLGIRKNLLFYNQPVIFKSSKVILSTMGNDTLTISGNYFGAQQRNTKLWFGNVVATKYLSWNDSLVTVITPPNTEGLKEIIFKQDSLTFPSGTFYLFSGKSIVQLCGTLEGKLTKDKSYLLKCNCEVPSGKTLTIEPGVLVVADHNQASPVQITVNGEIMANGSKTDTIRFLTLVAGPGKWKGIQISNKGTFKYTSVSNAEWGIFQNSGSTLIANSLFSGNKYGINHDAYQRYLTSVISDCYYTKNETGIYTMAGCRNDDGNASVTVSRCEISYNETGISLYAYGSTGTGWVTATSGSYIGMKLENSLLHNNKLAGMKSEARGYTKSASPFDIDRIATIDLYVNQVICRNNPTGIEVLENPVNSYAKTEIRNSDILNHSSRGIFNDGGHLYSFNSIYWGNNQSDILDYRTDSLRIEKNCIENNLFGGSNMSVNPQFTSLQGGVFTLGSSSPCIDAGSNKFVVTEKDMAGKVRKWNATNKDSAIVDIGAYEYGAPCNATNMTKRICAGDSFNGWTASGTYQLKYSNINQCDSIVLVKLTVDPPLVKPVFTVSGDTLKTTSTGTLQWYLAGQPVAGATGQKYNIKKGGEYSLKVTNTNGCFAFSDPKICIHTGLDDPYAGQMVIYPNPARERFFIRWNSAEQNDAVVSVWSASGGLVYRKEHLFFAGEQVEIHATGWAKGVYHLQITGGAYVWSGEVVKN